MRTFIKIIILFIFVYALLMLNLPKIEMDNYIQFKIYIFLGVVLFELIVTISEKLYKRQVLNVTAIIKSSIQSGLVAVVAYSIYIDLMLKKSYLTSGIDSVPKEKLIMSFIICGFILVNYGVENLLLQVSPCGINEDIFSVKFPLKSMIL